MIPKIIHQVWEGRKDTLPDFHRKLGETWKEYHPDWRYEFWNGNRMADFVRNALMITPPNHLFFETIITHLQTTSFAYTESKFDDVLSSTGPVMLTSLYKKFKDKSTVDFLSSELVSPWTYQDVREYLKGNADKEDLEKKIGKSDGDSLLFWFMVMI